MTWEIEREARGVQVWNADGTTRYKDASTGRWLSADDAQERLTARPRRRISTPDPSFTFSRSELEPIQYWPRRTQWKTSVGLPIEAVDWNQLQSDLRDIWEEHDSTFTHFFAGITAAISDSDGEGFETELKTLTMDTRQDSWPQSLYGDFGSKLSQLFQWADDYDTVFIVSVRTVGKVHTNA